MEKAKDKYIKQKILKHLKDKNLLTVNEENLTESNILKSELNGLNEANKPKTKKHTKHEKRIKNIKNKKIQLSVTTNGNSFPSNDEQVPLKYLQEADEENPKIPKKKKKSHKSNLKSKHKKGNIITDDNDAVKKSEEINDCSLNSLHNDIESNGNAENTVFDGNFNSFSCSDVIYYDSEDDSNQHLLQDYFEYLSDEETEEFVPKMIPQILTPKEKTNRKTILDNVHEYELTNASMDDVSDLNPFLTLVHSPYPPENCTIIIPSNYISLESNQDNNAEIENSMENNNLPEEETNIEENSQVQEYCENPQVEEHFENSFNNESHHESETNNKTMQSKFYNAVNSKYVLLHLKDPIYIYGTLKAKLLCGKAEIYGYCLKKYEPLTIFSPRGYSFLSIHPLENNDDEENSKEALIDELSSSFKEDFLQIDIEEILENFERTKEALLLLERNDNAKEVKMIRKYMKENLFPPSNFVNADTPHYASEFSLRCKFMNICKNNLFIDADWEYVANKISNNSKMLVVGGKSVGKSTLIKYILNKNIDKVKRFLFIDLDIGQSELVVPQTISATIIDQPLIGPGYFYSSSLNCSSTNKCYFFGDINMILRPLDYIKLVKTLIDDCHREDNFKNIPWIVNTMGYTEGFGAEIIKIIVRFLKPTDIIQIQGHKSIHNYEHILSMENLNTISPDVFPEMSVNFSQHSKNDMNEKNLSEMEESFECIPLYEVHLLQTKTKRKSHHYREWEMNPKDKRLANLITHFGKFLLGRDEWLTDIRPLCVCADDIEIIQIGDEISDKNSLLDVINANLIYLCRKSISVDESILLEFHGIGIVRGVDKFTKKIYIISTASIKMLENVNVIAIGNGIPLPASIITNQGAKVKDFIPYAYNTKDCISSKQINQYFFRPEHFLQKFHRNILMD